MSTYFTYSNRLGPAEMQRCKKLVCTFQDIRETKEIHTCTNNLRVKKKKKKVIIVIKELEERKDIGSN